MKVELVCLILSISCALIYECQEILRAKDTDGDVETQVVDEWQRYIKYNRNLILKIRKRKREQKLRKKNMETENKVVAPSFMLSRTRNGLIVKQHEAGLQSNSKGGFEFPAEPILLTNVQYKYDGSISPVIKLSETKGGVVGKKLEFGKAKSPGISWESRNGAAKVNELGRSGESINENGEINKGAGVSKNFTDGSISTRGVFRRKIGRTSKTNSFTPIEPLPDDESYGSEGSDYETDDNEFETEDSYYEEDDLIEGGQYEQEYFDSTNTNENTNINE